MKVKTPHTTYILKLARGTQINIELDSFGFEEDAWGRQKTGWSRSKKKKMVKISSSKVSVKSCKNFLFFIFFWLKNVSLFLLELMTMQSVTPRQAHLETSQKQQRPVTQFFVVTN